MITLYGTGIPLAFIRNVLISKDVPFQIHVCDGFRLEEREDIKAECALLAAIYLEMRHPIPVLISTDPSEWAIHVRTVRRILEGVITRTSLVNRAKRLDSHFFAGDQPTLIDMVAEPVIGQPWFTDRLRSHCFPVSEYKPQDNDDDDDDDTVDQSADHPKRRLV